jgi:hypothetical protein
MNNTEKKLDALIDALGFDVEGKYVVDEDNYEAARLASFGMFKVNKVDYIHPEFKFTKRDKPVENLLAGIFARITPVEPSTALKHELLTILKKAGKCPKKDTITLMNHEIDLAFKL